MRQTREIRGLWWLPETPDERWVGVLSFQVGKTPKLEITIPKPYFQFRQLPLPTVNGHDAHGRDVSLLFPGPPSATQASVLSHIRVPAGYAILGLSLKEASEFRVNNLFMRMQHLHEWMGITGFTKDKLDTLDEIRLHYTRPETQIFQLDSDLSVSFEAQSGFAESRSEKSFREDTIVSIRSRTGLDLPKSKTLWSALRGMLHFAVLERVYPTQILAFKDGHGIAFGEKFIRKEIEIWNSLIRDDIESEHFEERWVFRFADVRANFGVFFDNWLKFTETFEEALGCYFSTIYHSLPFTMELLALTQAIDAYHGARFPSHKKRDFLKKMEDIAATHQNSLSDVISDVGEFAKTVHQNRNYYTHHNPGWRREGRVAEGSKLGRLNEKLRLLFQVCVLTEMGIPVQRFQRIKRQIATHITDIM